MFEDDRSLRKHVESIKEEMRKRQPNTARIADKMKRTVEYRQRFCREKTTAEVLQEFPCLRMTAFVSMLFVAYVCCMLTAQQFISSFFSFTLFVHSIW